MILKAVTNIPGIWALVVASYVDWMPAIALGLAVILSLIRIGQALGLWRRPKR